MLAPITVNTVLDSDRHYPMAKKNSKAKESHSHLALQVKSYSARASASINHPVCTPTFIDEDDLAHSFGTDLEIIAVAHWPEERAEEEFWLSVYTLNPTDWRLRSTLKSFHQTDEHGTPQYRRYHGKDFPIYDLPKQIGFLQKNRHYGVWTGAAWVSPSVATDMLSLLLHIDTPYVAIHELRVQRKHGIVGISLQTNDPAEE